MGGQGTAGSLGPPRRKRADSRLPTAGTCAVAAASARKTWDCGPALRGTIMVQLLLHGRFQAVMTAGRRRGVRKVKNQRPFLVLLCPLLLAGIAAAQCPVTNRDDDLPPPLPTVTSSTRTGEPRLPESGYLSNTSYASTYFGFLVDLPIPVDGHRIMLPLMPPGQHALLAIGFQEGRRSGTLLITASEPPNPAHEMTEEERKAEFLAWAKGQPSQQITPPDWLTRTGRFYHIAKRSGDVTTVQYWTIIKNYLVRVKVSSNDAGFLRKTKEAVVAVKFYCAQEDGTLINEQGKIVPTPGEGYQGPTIPTAVVDAALADKPALELIERGEIGQGRYRNQEIGLSYSYPTTWEADHDDASPPAKDEIAQRTQDVLNACSLLLLHLTPPGAGTARADARQITLRAVDQTCLGLPAPMSATDHIGAEELGAYLQMLGAFGEVRSTSLAMRGPQLFAEYSGLVGEPAKGEALGRRRVEAAVITRHRKLLLVWTWAAASEAELAGLPRTSVSFEDAAPIDLAPPESAHQR